MTKNLKTKLSLITVLIGTLFLTSLSYAHFLWLNVSDYTPQIGEEVYISLGWGHNFPKTPKPPRKALVEKIRLFVIEPNGKIKCLKIKFSKNKPEPVKLRIARKGIYLVVALSKRFVSKTTEGYFYKPKNELKDKEVLYSKWAETTAIALISVGNYKKLNIFSIPGSNFYLLPLINPSILKQGDLLKVKVTFKNKPVSSWIFVTYAGFSNFKDTYAWTTRSNAKGIAYIKILKRGPEWLLRAEKITFYPNPTKADKAVYRCTFTFGF